MTSAIARGLICHSGWGHKQFAVNPSHPRKDTANCCAGISIYVYSIFFFPSLSCVLHESIRCGDTLCHLTGVVVVAFLSCSLGRSADELTLRIHCTRWKDCSASFCICLFVVLLPRHTGSCMQSTESLSPFSGGWMLLCEQLIMAEDGPHITMQRIIFIIIIILIIILNT